MTSVTFLHASRALRQKRRAFSVEVTAFLKDAYEQKDVTLDAFHEKQRYFERLWDEVVNSMESCVKLIDDAMMMTKKVIKRKMCWTR